MLTHSLAGAATGCQIGAAQTQRCSQPPRAGACRAARLWRTSGAFSGGIAKSPKKARALKLRKVIELQADAVPGPGFLDKELAEDLIIEEETDDSQDEESVPGRAEGSRLLKRTANKELPRQPAGPKRHRQQSSSHEDSSEEPFDDSISEIDMGDPQDEEYVPGRTEGSGQPKTPARKDPPSNEDSSEKPAEDAVSKEDLRDPQDEEVLPGGAAGSMLPKTPAKKERHRQQTGIKRHRQESPSREQPAGDTVRDMDVQDPQDEEYLPGRAQGSGQPKKVAEKERPRKKPRHDPPSTEDDSVSDPQDPEYMPGQAECSWLPRTPARREAPKKTSRQEPPSDEDTHDGGHPQRCSKRASAWPVSRMAYSGTSGPAFVPESSPAWQEDADPVPDCQTGDMSGLLSAAAVDSAYYASQTYYSGSTCAAASAPECQTGDMSGRLGAAAPDSAYYASQSYYSGSSCAAAFAFGTFPLHPAAMLSEMYQAGSAGNFTPAYQGALMCDALSPYTPAFGHSLGDWTPNSCALSTATSSRLPPVPDTAGGAVFDALLKSDSDLSRSTPFNLLSDALSTAAPAASAPETPQSACQPLCTGGPTLAQCQPSAQSFYAVRSTTLYQGFGHAQIPSWQMAA